MNGGRANFVRKLLRCVWTSRKYGIRMLSDAKEAGAVVRVAFAIMALAFTAPGRIKAELTA
jgi:hypothetical protein